MLMFPEIKGLLLDKEFIEWANCYVRRLCDNFSKNDFRLADYLRREAKAIGEPIPETSWKVLWDRFDFLRINIGIRDHHLHNFVKPLRYLYEKNPHLISYKALPKKRKAKRITVKSGFNHWADFYLNKLYKEVLLSSSYPEVCNLILLKELNDAALITCNTSFSLSELSKYKYIKEGDFRIDNPSLNKFVAPLNHIFKNRFRELPKGAISDSLAARKDLSDFNLEELPTETINVPSFKVEVGSRIGTKSFENDVVLIFTWYLKRNIRWVSSYILSRLTKVSQRDFEHWADNHPNLTWKESRRHGIFYYSLLPISNLGRKDMSTDNGSVNAGDQLPKELVIGSNEFDAFVTQLLSAKDSPVWRTSDTIAQKTNLPKEDIEKWADCNPALSRRPGNNPAEKKTYYALTARLATNSASKKSEEGKTKKNNKTVEAPSVTHQELFAFAMLHGLCGQLINVMDFYANRLATRHNEAFSHLTKAQKGLSDAVVLLKKDLKIREERLPPLDNI